MILHERGRQNRFGMILLYNTFYTQFDRTSFCTGSPHMLARFSRFIESWGKILDPDVDRVSLICSLNSGVM